VASVFGAAADSCAEPVDASKSGTQLRLHSMLPWSESLHCCCKSSKMAASGLKRDRQAYGPDVSTASFDASLACPQHSSMSASKEQFHSVACH
jgi:hypothetical protein